jgi:hypothetical protein
MPRLIKIESIAQDPPVEILQVDTGSLTIGREPENHIVVDSDSVSRQHGCLLEASEHWLFKDFESTNGTWVNGVRLTPGQVKLLRNGDVLQLADFPMRITELVQSDKPETPSILVFYNGRFENQFNFSSSGDLFAIGGPNGSYFIEGATSGQSQLQISYNGERLELTTGVSEVKVTVHGMASTGVTTLSDRDDILVGPYLLIVSDIRSASPIDPTLFRAGAGSSPIAGAGQAYDRPNVPKHLRRSAEEDWESEAARRKSTEGKRFVFGTRPDELEVTSTLQVSSGVRLGSSTGFEMSASQRFSRAVAEAEEREASPVTESVLIVFGIFVFCLIIGFLAYFFLVLS